MPTNTINIQVDDLDSVLALYDKIQVWKSDSFSGTYAEITAATSTSAVINGSVIGPWALNTKVLIITRDGAAPVTVTFSGTDPLILSSVLAQINLLVPGVASGPAGKIVLLSALVGTASSLQVSGNACDVLGLSTTPVVGFQSRVALTSPTTTYAFSDFSGASTSWYETRYYSSITQRVSSFSAPQNSNQGMVTPGGSTVVGSIHLSDLSGNPVVGRRIILIPMNAFLVPDSAYGALPGFDRITITTDSSGSASIPLLIGMSVRVLIEGSNFQRQLVVPSSNFDILQVATQQPDPLNIVQAPPMPIRVS